MSKLLSLLIAITMVISTTGASYAAFTSDDTEVYTASITVGGSASIVTPFSASLKNISGDTAATTVSWGAVTAGTTNWLSADQYIEVEGFATYADWGIQIYTDNKATNANPKYTGTDNPAGLVREDSTIYALPMCWRTKIAKLASGNAGLQINDATSNGFAVLDDGTTTDSYYPWFFMLDKGTPDVDISTEGNQVFGDYQNEATFIGSKGYHHAPGTVNYATPVSKDSIYYLYVGAKFTLAVPQMTYKTNKLTVEMYHL